MNTLQNINIVVAYHPGEKDEKFIPATVTVVGTGTKAVKPKAGHRKDSPITDGITIDGLLDALNTLAENHGPQYVADHFNYGTILKRRAEIQIQGGSLPKSVARDFTRVWLLTAEFNGQADMLAVYMAAMKTGKGDANLDTIFASPVNQAEIIAHNTPTTPSDTE